MEVPCGKCIGRLLDRAKDWAVRCMHEASSSVDNCFVTLTYGDLAFRRTPLGFPTLYPRDFVLFFKRLHKFLSPLTIRFFQCGEYGEASGKALGRPHYHCIIFGFRPVNLVIWSEKGGVKLYRSAFLERLWPHGFVIVGNVLLPSTYPLPAKK